MGQQIIKQPDGKFGVFSSVSNRILALDVTENELIELYREQAARRAVEEIKELLEKIKSNQCEPMSLTQAIKYHDSTNMVDNDKCALHINKRVDELKK